MDKGIFEHYNEVRGASLELMSFYEWIGEIKRLHHEGQSLPAVPLIEAAFSLNEESFVEYERNSGMGMTYFDSARTHRELERAGIVAPAIDDELLRAYQDSMLSRDPELRELVVYKRSVKPANRRSA